MGPLYGGFFLALSETLAGQAALTRENFGAALSAGVDAVQDVGNAQVGDKTLINTLVPARDAYEAALEAGQPLSGCLDAMVAAARAGQQSTLGLQAENWPRRPPRRAQHRRAGRRGDELLLHFRVGRAVGEEGTG